MDTIYTVKTGRIRLKEPVHISNTDMVASPRDAYAVLRQLLDQEDETQEHFYVVLFNMALRPIMWKKMFTGGMSNVLIDPKIILRWAILNGASSFMLAHNHPSGNLEPSREDMVITRQLKDAAAMMDLQLLDHLIFDRDGYYSFSESGRMF